jgi:sugar/nucleoside kinase (ribokinase family)
MKNSTPIKNPLLIVGSVAYDSVETPFGKAKKMLGGSASYFSFGSIKFAPTSIVGIVGEDFKELNIFKKLGINTSGILQTKGQTFHWEGKYNSDLSGRETLKTELGVFANFRPVLSNIERQSEYVFLGNIHPKLQLDVLMQIKKPKFVGLDTMNYWMSSALSDLKVVLKKVDILIINDSEARQLSGENNLLKSAERILGLMARSKILIIKRGEHGLTMFQGKNIFSLPAYPLKHVVDPTGAGDAFAGALFGYLTKTNDTSWKNLKQSCLYATVMGSFCVEKMGSKKLLEIKILDIEKRLKELKELASF